jgi:hypothetical protein
MFILSATLNFRWRNGIVVWEQHVKEIAPVSVWSTYRPNNHSRPNGHYIAIVYVIYTVARQRLTYYVTNVQCYAPEAP